MVMSSEAKENTRNGKSRGNSPNSIKSTDSKLPADNLTPEVSDDDNNSKKNLGKNNGKSEFEEKIRVGKNYQVVVPEMIPMPETYPDKALLVWSPAKWIPESKLDEYITLAKESYSYNSEQALGMLFWHKHDLEKAVIDLANFTPYPDEWTKEEKALFAQAFQFHGKCFYRIRQMLPDKSIASLVKFYYSWKKTRIRVLERQEKKKKGESENGSPDESDVEEKNDSDDEDQVKDAETIGDINEIIGVSKDENEEGTKTGKTSIMTTSTGKTLKRKHDDEDTFVAEETITEKKKVVSEPRPEISITPIPKASSVSVA